MATNKPCNGMQIAGNNGDLKSGNDNNGLKEWTLIRTDNHDSGGADSG